MGYVRKSKFKVNEKIICQFSDTKRPIYIAICNRELAQKIIKYKEYGRKNKFNGEKNI